MNFVMIGMPGVGKSCMGRYIARKFNLRFLDGDKLIERRYGKRLFEIINEVGNEGFKKIEEEVLLSIEGDGLVISPGGSAIYYENVMEKFKREGKIIYLYASPEVIIQRLGDFSKRGIVLAEGETIYDLYNERARYFDKYADIRISCNGCRYSKYQSDAIREVSKYIPLPEKKNQP
jgi:shikimate kinase